MSLVEADSVSEKGVACQIERRQRCALLIYWVAVLVLVSAGESIDPLVWLVIREVGAVIGRPVIWDTGSVERVCDGSLVDDRI